MENSVKNQAVTVSHLKSLYQFAVFGETWPYAKKNSIIAQFSLDILQIWYWELFLEGLGVPDHTHTNELNWIDVFVYA